MTEKFQEIRLTIKGTVMGIILDDLETLLGVAPRTEEEVRLVNVALRITEKIEKYLIKDKEN